MKAILLARVSDKKQDSNEAQLIRVNDYIKFKDLEVIKTHQIEESSTRGDRKKFQEIIKEIKQSKECIALVVDTVDRLQRSFRESVLLDDLRKSGKIELHFYRENLVIHKSSNSADLLRWDMAVMFARSYILQLSDNVKRKLDELKKNGIWPGKAPIGYKNIGERGNRDILVDTQKAPLVARLFELYATGGYSIQTLTVAIYKKGLRSYSGKQISQSMIYKILNNPFYYGEMRYCGMLYPHKYEPIISKDLYTACQAIQKGWLKKKFQYAAKPFALRGLLHCAKCGCTMSPEVKKGRYVYYSCTTARRAICNKKIFIREEALLQPVYEALQACSKVPGDTINELIDLLRIDNDQNIVFHAEAAKALKSEHDSLVLKQSRLTDLLLESTIDRDTFEKKSQEFNEREKEIKQQMVTHSVKDESVQVTAEIVLRLVKNAYFLLQSSEVPEKRALLNFALQNSVVNGKKHEFTMASPFQELYDIASHPLGCPSVDTFRTLDWKNIKEKLKTLPDKFIQAST